MSDYLTEAIEAATARVHEMLLRGGHKCEEIGAEAVRAAAPIIERAVRDKIKSKLLEIHAKIPWPGGGEVCDHCVETGSTVWPCATIKALEP